MSEERDTASWSIYVPAVSIEERVHRGEHLLLWQARGRSRFSLAGKELPLLTEQGLWIPAGARHAFTVQPNSVLLALSFSTRRTATTLHEPTIVTFDADLRTLFLAAMQSQYSIVKPTADIGRQILALLEGAPSPHAALPLPVTETARSVAEMLRCNPGDSRGVSELAAGVHVSERTLERVFLAETGVTLRQWRILNRMETAALLLRDAASVEAVAHRVGYTDSSAFRRMFRRRFGVSPSEYVAAARVARSDRDSTVRKPLT